MRPNLTEMAYTDCMCQEKKVGEESPGLKIAFIHLYYDPNIA